MRGAGILALAGSIGNPAGRSDAPHNLMKNSAILLISCPDQKGEVATIADFVYRHGGNILHADEHADEESSLFLMRVEFDPKDFDIDLSEDGLADFARHFEPIAAKFQMQ